MEALHDGAEALLVDGRDRRRRRHQFANSGDDEHAVGTLAPLVPGYVGCIVIRPDGSRQLACVERNPLTQQ